MVGFSVGLIEGGKTKDNLDSIVDIVRIPGRLGGGLSMTVNDENGSMSLPLCRLHGLRASAEADEIRRAVMQRQLSE